MNFYNNTTFKNLNLIKDKPIRYKINQLDNPYFFAILLEYYLHRYLLNKFNIHSKKASIIITQIIHTSHFARRTVYLSSTQIYPLKLLLNKLHHILIH